MNITTRKSANSVPTIRNRIEDDMTSFQREMNNLVGSFFNRGDLSLPLLETSFYPSVDIVEKENKYLLDADIPGMKDDDVTIDFHDNILTIRGEKKSETKTKDEEYVCIERSYGSFRRDIPFSDDIDQDSIKAELKNGVLHMELTKKERSKETHRKIQIKH